MTVETDPGLVDRQIGRYSLRDLIAEDERSSLWRGYDPMLERDVSVRLVPDSDPTSEALRDACLRAAQVDDRRVVPILDVLEERGQLAVVSEWVDGTPWSQLLEEPWSPQEALVVGLEIARGLEAAHAVGVSHGRIRPHSVMITETREVRLRGLGVDSVLYGEPANPMVDDLEAIGRLVYLGVTRRWPAERGDTFDGLSAIHPVEGRYPDPSSLVADLPKGIDRVCSRSLYSQDADPQSWGYSDVAECRRSVDHLLGELGTASVTDVRDEAMARTTDRLAGKMSTWAIFAFAAVGLGLLGWQLVSTLGSSDPVAEAESPAEQGLPNFATPLPEEDFTIAGARAFDPMGDGGENDENAGKAIDDKRGSAWRTAAYPNATMNPKTGVGLVLDLGGKRTFRAVSLRLVGTGSDLTLYASNKNPKDLSGMREIATVSGIGDTIKVRAPKAMKAKYVVVWFTGLPYDGANYVGGVRDVKVIG